MSGTLVTVEGVEGSGKSTLLSHLVPRLEAAGHRVVRTREPGGTPLGERVRDVVLDAGHESVSAWTELFLMLAARAQLVETVLRPALDRGDVVLCDRYMDASTAYQGAGRELGIDRVERLNEWATGDLIPDLTVLVDLDPERGRQRLQREHDRMERESLEFHRRVRDGYLEIARRHTERFVVVDGSQSPDEVARVAWEHLGRILAQLPPWDAIRP